MQKQIKQNNIAMCEQQLLGFYHAKFNRGDIKGLIEAMGMTKEEWVSVKENYNLEYLDKDEFTEIEDFFKAVC